MKKSLLIIIIIFVVAGFGVGAYFLMRDFGEDTVMIEETTSDNVVTSSDETSGSVSVEDLAVPPEWEHDKDRDGISNEQEAILGTSETEFDTDGDGLSDDVEINTLGTDPTNPDTDGDGYADGFEVINNYNPNGEGELVQ